MITLGGHIYAVGGYDGKNGLLSVERYDRYLERNILVFVGNLACTSSLRSMH